MVVGREAGGEGGGMLIKCGAKQVMVRMGHGEEDTTNYKQGGPHMSSDEHKN